jgi:hypothetical protein
VCVTGDAYGLLAAGSVVVGVTASSLSTVSTTPTKMLDGRVSRVSGDGVGLLAAGTWVVGAEAPGDDLVHLNLCLIFATTIVLIL